VLHGFAPLDGPHDQWDQSVQSVQSVQSDEDGGSRTDWFDEFEWPTEADEAEFEQSDAHDDELVPALT
jgi:hypothetical protein